MEVQTDTIRIHYEKRGSGRPLIMLHGNGESGKIFNAAAKRLASQYTVFLPDSRDHGQSEQTGQISYPLMAEDLYDFIQKLNIQKPILYGFSDGGIIALLFAVQHPDIPAALIVSGANTTPAGLKPIVRLGMQFNYLITKSKKTKMMLREPNITKEMLQSITVPTLVTCGGQDMIKECDSRFIAENIPHAALQILRGENHGSYIVNSTKIAEIIQHYITQTGI